VALGGNGAFGEAYWEVGGIWVWQEGGGGGGPGGPRVGVVFFRVIVMLRINERLTCIE